MTVANCHLNGRMWSNSSRGPGQFFGQLGTNKKPDVMAPTPRNGCVVYGSGLQSRNWGTSGACPQVAGLAALLLSADPDLKNPFDIIRETAVPQKNGYLCEGHGMIHCANAVKSLQSQSNGSGKEHMAHTGTSPKEVISPKRYLIKAPTDTLYEQALALVEPHVHIYVKSKRRYMLSTDELPGDLKARIEAMNVKVQPEYQYDLDNTDDGS